MSGDLKHPSKAIPKGTLYGLGLTFVSYAIVILAMAASITRESFYANTNVIQLVGSHTSSPELVLTTHRQTFLASLFCLENSRLQRFPF
jgi:amino acid transporter